METVLNMEGVSVNTAVADNQEGSGRDYYDFKFAQGVYTKLIDGWGGVVDETDRQRALRYVKDADSNSLRENGTLKPDEVYTPVRLIDSNIRGEQPALIQYITQSRRSIIFASPNSEPIDGIEKLEEDFTLKARYLGWEIPFIQNLDGSQAHAWDAVEIIFDPDYPGNFCIEHIGHDRLIFSIDSEDIEAQEVIAIRKMLTNNQLRSMVKEGSFNSEQVEKLIGSGSKTLGLTDSSNECYKIFFKQEGIVHVAWYAKNCDEYLKEPAPLFLGLRDFTVQPPPPNPLEANILPLPQVDQQDYPPIFETEFPVVQLKYIESNDPRIIELQGRCKLDEASQEAASAIQSGMVNGTIRASNVMASPAQTPLDATPSDLPILTDVFIGNGRMFSKPVNFFTTPWPRAECVQFLQAVVTQNKQELGNVNFSVLNRKDSGKTATEIQAASKESQELSGVQVILMSIFIRRVYAKCWRIYQNRVLQGKLIIKDPYLLKLFGEDVKVDNNFQVISCKEAKNYIIKSSGDVDVVQRQEKLNRLMQGWEVFGKTPIASEYLKDILRYSFPEDAVRYITILENGVDNQYKALLEKTSQVLKAVIIDPATGGLIPSAQQFGPQLQQLAQQIQQALSGQGEQMMMTMGQQQP
jgi:hypothetical protein